VAILLLFNENDKNSYEDIVKATQLHADVLDPALGIFVKAKVLNMTNLDGTAVSKDEAEKPGPNKTFSLNYDFKSKKIRVNLNIAVKSEQKQEVDDTHKTIEEDRKLRMQSAIVRIMKARKKMKHTQLVSETINQIRSRFVPKIPDIKKCIDILLEKEYLERLDDDELGYLA